MRNTADNSEMNATRNIAQYADEYLRIREIEDWPNALNGLQLENSGTVRKIAAAVDVSTRAIEGAADAKARSRALGGYLPELPRVLAVSLVTESETKSPGTPTRELVTDSRMPRTNG